MSTKCAREKLTFGTCPMTGCLYRLGSGLPCKQRADEEEARQKMIRDRKADTPTPLLRPFRLRAHGAPIPPAKTRTWESRAEDSQIVSVSLLQSEDSPNLSSLADIGDEPTQPSTPADPPFEPGGGSFGGGGASGDY